MGTEAQATLGYETSLPELTGSGAAAALHSEVNNQF